MIKYNINNQIHSNNINQTSSGTPGPGPALTRAHAMRERDRLPGMWLPFALMRYTRPFTWSGCRPRRCSLPSSSSSCSSWSSGSVELVELELVELERWSSTPAAPLPSPLPSPAAPLRALPLPAAPLPLSRALPLPSPAAPFPSPLPSPPLPLPSPFANGRTTAAVSAAAVAMSACCMLAPGGLSRHAYGMIYYVISNSKIRKSHDIHKFIYL
jgi:hypothetical protein